MTCSHKKSEVVDTRKRDGYIIRRRKCVNCGGLFSSVEVPVEVGSGGVSAIDALQRDIVKRWMKQQLEKL